MHAVSELNFTLVPIAQNSKIGFSGSRSNAFDTWLFCTHQAAAALLHKSRLDSGPPSSPCILEMAFFPFLLIASVCVCVTGTIDSQNHKPCAIVYGTITSQKMLTHNMYLYTYSVLTTPGSIMRSCNTTKQRQCPLCTHMASVSKNVANLS